MKRKKRIAIKLFFIFIFFLISTLLIWKGGNNIVRIINLTPHNITWVKPNGETQVIESSGLIRCRTISTLVETVEDELLVYANSYSLEEELPAPEAGVFYVVNTIVATALSGKRNDVLVVNDTIRDDSGRIIGCVLA